MLLDGACCTTPRIGARAGLAALSVDAVTLRITTATTRTFANRPANPLMPGTRVPERVDYRRVSAVASRVSFRAAASKLAAALPTPAPESSSAVNWRLRYAAWLAM